MRNLRNVIVILSVASSLTACHKPASETNHPKWCAQSVIYEMNVRQYTPQGTFAAAEEHLPRLAKEGFDLIWLMPVQPIGVEGRKGTLGSYYAISDYYATNPEFGTKEQLLSFVRKAHSLGQKVILDWVANHTSRDAVWLAEHRDWYQLDSLGEAVKPEGWDDVAALDYSNKQMRQAMIEAMKYWLTDMEMDGLRCDVAWNVPVDFWNEAVGELKKVKPELFMLAEAEKPELHDKAFDMTYAWKFHHLINKIAKQRANADSLRNYMIDEARNYRPSDMRMLFTSNHDENSWAGTERERMGAADRTFAALTYILPGMPLVYSGQEVGFDRRLQFFEKDSVDWVDRGSYADLYTRLNALRHSSSALATGQQGGETIELVNSVPLSVYSLVRTDHNNTVAAIFNLSNKAQNVDVSFGDFEGEYTDIMADKPTIVAEQSNFQLQPWDFIIFNRQDK